MIGSVAAVVVLAGVAAVAVPRLVPGCGEQVTEVSAADSTSPFLDAAQRTKQPDHDRDTLVEALQGDPAPFGRVLGAVGYHYEQWAQLSAFEQGIGVRTRDNPDFTMLDDRTLEPRWSVQVGTRRSTYDASAKRYLVATMPSKAAPDLVALDAEDGHRLWCTTLGEDPVGPTAPFATQILPDQDVAVLTPAGGDRERLVRIDGQDASQVWARTLDADSGDFVGEMGPDRLLLGGRAQSELFDVASVAARPAGPALVLVSTRDGKTIWTRPASAGVDVHVLGVSSATAVLQEWNTRSKSARLVAVDSSGNQDWYAVPARGAGFDAVLRSGRILVRAGVHWSAYAVKNGHLLWTRTVPRSPQFLPYGFELSGMAMLDADHALIGGTTALHTLDLRTGAMTAAALPTDGISTTYWPYQTVASPGLVAVATNTGAAVLRRE